MLAEKANPKRTPKNVLGKDDFMKLFIAQMQSQDPLSPQDSSQMAAQMAQFNGLEQMMNVNKSLETMLQNQAGDRAVSMVNYVGKEVDVGTGMLKWDKGKLTKTTFEVDQPLGSAFVEVRDSSGRVIAQKDLGNIMPGEHNLKWDGKLKDNSEANPGIYHFSVVGKSVEGQDVPIPIKSKVKITGVDLQTPGGAFFTELGKLAVKEVASVGIQGFEDAKMATATLETPVAKTKDNNSNTDKEEKTEAKLPPPADEIPTNSTLANSESDGGVNLPVATAKQTAEGIEAAEEDPADPAGISPGLGNLNIPVTFAGG